MVYDTDESDSGYPLLGGFHEKPKVNHHFVGGPLKKQDTHSTGHSTKTTHRCPRPQGSERLKKSEVTGEQMKEARWMLRSTETACKKGHMFFFFFFSPEGKLSEGSSMKIIKS